MRFGERGFPDSATRNWIEPLPIAFFIFRSWMVCKMMKMRAKMKETALKYQLAIT